MRIGFGLMAFAAAAALGLSATPARAATMVTYTTVGTFGSSGTNTFTSGGGDVTITFNGITTQTVSAPSGISFGTFDTSATTAASPVAVSDTFTLQLFQTAPTVGGPITYVGSLTGTLSVDSSGAYILFAGPFTQTIDTVSYTLTEADSNTPGRADLVPPSVNGGVSSVEGTVAVAAVPEPASLALLGIGLPALICGLRLRRS